MDACGSLERWLLRLDLPPRLTGTPIHGGFITTAVALRTTGDVVCYEFPAASRSMRFCLEPLKIGKECVFYFLACGEHHLRILAGLFFLCLTFFLRGRPLRAS
jgi:hypothetical protein